MSAVAIITARGGSKRIPRKNIKDFLGKPIIAYSIEAAKESALFDMIMVSTDDDEIATIARHYGAEVPFLRSKENSDDYAGTAVVIEEVINELQKQGKLFDHACCIYPTAPFITPAILKDTFSKLQQNNHSTVFPVCAFSYPVQRSLRINEDGRVEMNFPENLTKRSQDLPKAYHDAGQFYWLAVERFMENKKLFTEDSGAVELDELQVQDIDSEMDWKLAELKYNLIKRVDAV